jgi:hypothetical protein
MTIPDNIAHFKNLVRDEYDHVNKNLSALKSADTVPEELEYWKGRLMSLKIIQQIIKETGI